MGHLMADRQRGRHPISVMRNGWHGVCVGSRSFRHAAIQKEEDMVDQSKLEDFVHKALGDIGSALTASLVVIGDKLGLYRAMVAAGPVTSAELAKRTET